MLQFCRSLWSDEQGQDIAEYAVILAVGLILVVGMARLIGLRTHSIFGEVAREMRH